VLGSWKKDGKNRKGSGGFVLRANCVRGIGLSVEREGKGVGEFVLRANCVREIG